MARRCDDCRKGAMSGHNVSHSKRRTKRKFYPNLHSMRVEVKGGTKKLKLCTRCMRTRKKNAKVKS